ncbi:type II secretion system protein [Candidatus Gottesmanbacteria bacterium]|nr:type II secretion system protein [Candidatus Gottesmanbacteria bacterium]
MRKAIQKGFTMIELLVVIAVIGVMATAVLSAINPLEQINKGNDTGLRSDAEQVLGAVDRYYSSLAYFPWQNGANDNFVNVAWQNVIDLNTNRSALTNMENTQEIKHGFTLRLTDVKRTPIYLMYDNSSASPTMYACFVPKSNSFLTEAFNRCKGTAVTAGTPFGATGEACAGTVGASTTCNTTKNCYVCLP